MDFWFIDLRKSLGILTSLTFSKIIVYILNVMRQSACLVINPITVDGYAALFNCTPVDRPSDSMMARPKAIHFSWLGQELLSVAWSTAAQLIIFFCFRFSVVLFDVSSVTSSGVVKLLPLFRYDCSRIQTCFSDLRKVCIGRYILQCAQGGC